MLDDAVGYLTATNIAEAAVAPDAPPARAILEVKVLDARTTRFGGIVVTSNNDPMFAMARRLIEEGFDPETTARFVWASTGTLSFRGTLGALAQWTVEENDRGIRLRRYRAPRMWGVPGSSGSDDPSAT